MTLWGLQRTASGTGAGPARRLETDAGFRVQRISDDFRVAQRLCRPCRSPIEETASVSLAGGTKPVYFQSFPIVQIPAHRSAHDGDADELAVLLTAKGKLVSPNRLVVPVMFRDKSVGIRQGNGDQFQHNSLSVRPVVQVTSFPHTSQPGVA